VVFLSIVALAVGAIFSAGVKSVEVDFLDVLRNPLSLPFHASFSNADPTSAAALSFYAIGTPIFVVGIWFLAATTIKRLHDRNKRGWWAVLFLIAPPLLSRLWDWLDNPTLALLVSALAFGLSVWGLVELYCRKGTRGPNRFGPDPLAPVATGTASRWDQNSELEFVPLNAGPLPGPHVKRGHE
jgi:uncharacterized membrane protein YhaH (DUF805 family)